MDNQLIALIGFALVSTGSPGGATTLATASGTRFGYRRSLPLILGIATALALLITSSGAGLSAVLLAIPSLELVMKLFGSAYLLWLAVLIALAGPPESDGGKQATPLGFAAGALLLVVNPKAWSMAVGVAASFSSISEGLPMLLLFGGVFFFSAMLSLSLWAQLGNVLARLLTSKLQWHVYNGAMALLLVASILTFWLPAIGDR